MAKSLQGHEVWFVGGFLSQLYDALSEHLEGEANAALQRSARSLNVHFDLPGGRRFDIDVGDAIADALPEIDLPIERGRFVSFYSQMRDFDEKRIPYRNIALAAASFDTSRGVEHNGAAILELLRQSDKKVIFVTHSKGSLDTLHALLQAPELWGKRVVGWVALQAPFYGSPLADRTPEAIRDLLLDALGGNPRSVDDLTTAVRARYMQDHKDEIRVLTSRMTVISAYTTYEADATVGEVASAFAGSVFSADLVSQITAVVSARYAETPRDLPRVIGAAATESVELVRKRVAEAWSEALGTVSLLTLTNVYLRDISKVPNDGLVPEQSTVLPGAARRELPTGDHASPVMDVDPFKNYWTERERNQITLSLIQEVRGRR